MSTITSFEDRFFLIKGLMTALIDSIYPNAPLINEPDRVSYELKLSNKKFTLFNVKIEKKEDDYDKELKREITGKIMEEIGRIFFEKNPGYLAPETITQLMENAYHGGNGIFTMQGKKENEGAIFVIEEEKNREYKLLSRIDLKYITEETFNNLISYVRNEAASHKLESGTTSSSQSPSYDKLSKTIKEKLREKND